MSDTPRTDEWQHVYVCQKYVEENGLDEGTDAALNLMRDLERKLNALDRWDRDNIDDAIDREGAE